jgi:hypothetical protein
VAPFRELSVTRAVLYCRAKLQPQNTLQLPELEVIESHTHDAEILQSSQYSRPVCCSSAQEEDQLLVFSIPNIGYRNHSDWEADNQDAGWKVGSLNSYRLS